MIPSLSPLILLGCGLIIVVGGILWLRLHAFLALVLGAYGVALLTPIDARRTYAQWQLARGEISEKAARQSPDRTAAARVAIEFGKSCASLGILIAMATILGEAMLLSGAAESIASALLRWLGAARAHWAFFLTSFLLCIPVMLDTVFYLLSPLIKAVARRAGRNYLLLILCAVAGGTITHSLVPPTPGPLFVAGELGVPLSLMIGMGCAIGFPAALAGVVFAKYSNLRHVVEVPPDEAPAAPAGLALPPLWLSLVPVIMPIGLIALDASLAPLLPRGAWTTRLVQTVGDKDMAVTFGALAALITVARFRGGAVANKAVQVALGSGAAILLIIAAGGAFGGVLRQTGISESLSSMLAGMHLFALPAVFLITAFVRTAQGSATVAMITAAPIAKAFLDGGVAPVNPVYFAIAIGCGSKPFSWMNDAGFWIFTRLSGLREEQTLRTISPMIALQGCAGLVLTMIAAWLFPLT